MADTENLTLTTINGIGFNAANWATDYAASQLTNALFGHKDTLKFYYDKDSGGSVLQVLVKGVAHGALSTLSNMAVNAFNGMINGKSAKPEIASETSRDWNNRLERGHEDDTKYGKMVLKEGTVYALDDWGEISIEALMLSVKTDKEIHVKQKFPNYAKTEGNDSISVDFLTDTLVWYDTTALININSDKNVIATKVQGRDYTRKELVSNGDIKFSVSGQISSGLPDVYPTAEVEKFYKIMQHKGIVQVNYQPLNVLGIEQILITDFNLSAKEGSKSVQSYSFSGLGLQPAREIVIEQDTVEFLIPKDTVKEEDNKNPWISMVENKAKAAATDIFSRSTALATGMLENIL